MNVKIRIFSTQMFMSVLFTVTSFVAVIYFHKTYMY